MGQSPSPMKNKAKNHGKSLSHQTVSDRLSKDVVVLFVKEIARSKDETIQSKNQMIELLMNTRMCVSCSQSRVGV